MAEWHKKGTEGGRGPGRHKFFKRFGSCGEKSRFAAPFARFFSLYTGFPWRPSPRLYRRLVARGFPSELGRNVKMLPSLHRCCTFRPGPPSPRIPTIPLARGITSRRAVPFLAPPGFFLPPSFIFLPVFPSYRRSFLSLVALQTASSLSEFRSVSKSRLRTCACSRTSPERDLEKKPV